MRNLFLTLFALAALISSCGPGTGSDEPVETAGESTERPEYAIVIHGGAGSVSPGSLTPEKEAEYREALNTALQIGEDILKEGGSSLDAVEATIRYMEDSPLFNSGRGAVFTHEGRNELDASIMDGNDLNAGAVGGVTIVRNPISAARAVMANSPHVLLTGAGAEEFAISQGLDTVPPSYFFTQGNWEVLQRVLEREEKGTGSVDRPDYKYGTVGCAALDKEGNLAAGTSTGGMTNKRYNRIGDSPIIGAGTYADNRAAAISCTGHGEYFIRNAVAFDVVARMRYQGSSLEEATNEIIHGVLNPEAGAGGLIAVDWNGNIVMPFNTPGMFRGYARPGERVVAMYKDE